MIYALRQAGFNCNYILGGLFSDTSILPGNYQSDNPWLIIEVDESDGSIHSFEPTISLVVNVDWDHADYYQTKRKCIATFQGLVDRTKEQVFINDSCEISKELNLDHLNAAVHSFGENGDARLIHFEDRTLRFGGSLPDCVLPVPFDELFNAHNALAALSVVNDFTEISPSLFEGFSGLWRRQELLYEEDGFCIIEDYGHHPTEIRKLFEALSQRDGPLIVVFQPHRYSRTLQFKHDFAEVLSKAHQLIVMEVYGAGEEPIGGGTGTDLFEVYSDIAPHRESFFCSDGPAVLKRLGIISPSKGVLLFLGAGNIQNVAAEYITTLDRPKLLLPFDFAATVEESLSADSVFMSDEPLANKTTLRVGGNAEYYAEPASETDLQLLLRFASKASLPVLFLGRGSNVIVPDSGVKGLVIRLNQPFFQQVEILKDGRIRARAGLRLKELCGFMRKNELAGFEFLEGIPGNVGGALRMNAGAMGGWISDVISEVVLMDYYGKIFSLPYDQLHFGYRHCRELLETIGLAVIFKGGVTRRICNRFSIPWDSYQNSRKESQPRQPSAGCTFKNPEGSAAGMLVDQSGLKGFGVGSAEVSDIHANFIINKGNASASDVILLINKLRKKVYQKTGYKLEPEVILFGDHWKNYLDPLPEKPCTTEPVSSG